MSEKLERLRLELAAAEAFHRVAVKQRDLAWSECDRLRGEVATLKIDLLAARAPMKWYMPCARHMGIPWVINVSGPTLPVRTVCPHCEQIEDGGKS